MGAVEQVAAKGADQFFDRGVLGLVCVLLILAIIGLCFVIRTLFRKIDKLQDAAIGDRDKLIGTINDSEKSLNELTSAMNGVQRTLEARGQTVGELSHQLALQNEQVGHKLANLSQAMKMIASAVRRRGSAEPIEEDA